MTTKTLPDYISETAEGYKVTLNKPIDVDGAKVFEVNIREPNILDMMAGEMQAKGQGEIAKEVIVFANLCDLSPESIKLAKLRDYQRIQEAFGLFTD